MKPCLDSKIQMIISDDYFGNPTGMSVETANTFPPQFKYLILEDSNLLEILKIPQMELFLWRCFCKVVQLGG